MFYVVVVCVDALAIRLHRLGKGELTVLQSITCCFISFYSERFPLSLVVFDRLCNLNVALTVSPM